MYDCNSMRNRSCIPNNLEDIKTDCACEGTNLMHPQLQGLLELQSNIDFGVAVAAAFAAVVVIVIIIIFVGVVIVVVFVFGVVV